MKLPCVYNRKIPIFLLYFISCSLDDFKLLCPTKNVLIFPSDKLNNLINKFILKHTQKM